jgi:hypothetical protein
MYRETIISARAQMTVNESDNREKLYWQTLGRIGIIFNLLSIPA